MDSSSYSQQLLVIMIMMILGFYVQELPGSNVLQSLLPEWPFIFSLYFAVSSRYFFGLMSGAIIGLLEDVFLNVPLLGLHMAVYIIAAFVMITIRLRFKHMTIFSQSLIIGALVLFKVLIVIIYDAVLYSFPKHFWVLLSVPLSMLVWPIIHLFFGFFSRHHE